VSSASPRPRQIFARRAGFLGLPQAALVVGGGPLEQREQALAALPARGGLRILGRELELHVVALGKPLQRTRESIPWVSHTNVNTSPVAWQPKQ